MRASPLGSSRRAVTVCGCIVRNACATARRRSCGLPPTSTMWTSPASSTWLRDPPVSVISGRNSSPRSPQGLVEIVQLTVDPLPDAVCAHVGADALVTPPAFTRRHHERVVQGLRLLGDVEGVHRYRPLAELLMGTRVLGQNENAVALVHERRLLRDEVHTVENRVHEQDVVLLVRRHGAWKVVLDAHLQRHPAG